MKNSIIKTSGLIIAILLLINEQITAQVGIGTTTPDATSMLEIQSTAKGVLIPRMTTAQRTAIASPATGLLVFDTETSSFWFYSGAWVELIANTGNLNLTGNVRIGDGTNNTYIESDGSLSYEGTATRWDDLKVSVNSVKVKGGTNDPQWAILISGFPFYAYMFDDSGTEDAFFMVQMPHAWKEGTDIMPHVHWMAESATAGDVVWTLEYIWANPNETFPASASTVSGSTLATDFTYGAKKHLITPLGTGGMNGSGKTLSSMIVCRLYREGGNASDTLSGDAGLLEIDFHFQLDSDGSRVEYTK